MILGLVPDQCARLVNADQRLAALERVRAQLIEFIKFYPLYGHASTMIGGVKTALELLGVCERWLLPPMIGADDQQVARVRETLTKAGLL